MSHELTYTLESGLPNPTPFLEGGGGTIFPGSDQLNRSQKTERKLFQHSEKSK